MSSAREQVVIVGGGHAGVSVAALLRQNGFDGNLLLLDEQAVMPYQRPILSKGWLVETPAVETALLRPDSFYERNRIQLRLASQVSAIERESRNVRMSDGERIPYDRLILACGASARRPDLPGIDPAHVLALRTMADADRIKAALRSTGRLVVLGGGYVGLEVAASARSAGCEVVIVERESRLLARVASSRMAQWFAELHGRHGVQFRFSATVASVQTQDDRFVSAELATGEQIAGDQLLIAVGAQPRDELAQACGLLCRGGVVVDANAQTSDPAIYALGDMTHRPIAHYGRSGRIESVANALEQARQAAWAILRKERPSLEVPWFWSDQYGHKLQIAGLLGDEDRVVVRTGQGTSLAVYHLLGDRVRCVEAVDSAQDFVAGKLLIASGAPIEADALADATRPLKSIVSAIHAVA